MSLSCGGVRGRGEGESTSHPSAVSEQDEDAAQVDEAQVIERMTLIADDQSAEIAEPREEPLNLPTPLVAPQRAAILGLGTFATAPVRRDHLDPEVDKRLVQGVCVVGEIPDEPLREIRYKAGVEGGSDEGNLVRRSRGGTDGERKTSAVCHGHELRAFAPLGFAHTPSPLFATTKVPSMKHSDRSSLPRSLRSEASAPRTRSTSPYRPRAR